MKFLLWLMLTTCALSGWAQAQAYSPGLSMTGEAQLKVLFWPVYRSRLFSPSGEYREGDRPLRLEIRYLRAIKAHQLVSSTGDEWEQLGIAADASGIWLDTLHTLFPDVQKNDVLALEVDENDVSTFYLNQQPLGRIEDTAFGQSFLDIWLSPQTSRPKLRQQLTGQR